MNNSELGRLLDYILKGKSKKENSPRRNISPRIWGPPGWDFLDKIVEGFPVRANKTEQQRMLVFLTSLGYVLPCDECRYNYINFTKSNSPKNFVKGRRLVKKWFLKYREHAKKES